jgi:hypothetical protein
MTPFQLAWVFLKAESKHFSQQLSDLFNPPSPDDMTSAQIEAEMRSFENNPQNSAYINLRDQNHPAPKPAPMGNTHQTRLPGTDEPSRHDIEMQNAGRRLADQKEKARAHLNQYPPRLYRQKDSDGANYAMMAGDKNLGNVSIDGSEGRNGIGYGEVNRPYQRQGLYGSALQGIINDTGSLSSTARNRQSGPFHEQFNPPNVKRQRGGNYEPIDAATFELGNGGAYDYSEINYTQLPAKETPRDWGDLQYDTGAMPVFEDKGPQQIPALNPRDREQASLARWGYIPGQQTYN